jgi:hypothetical protein
MEAVLSFFGLSTAFYKLLKYTSLDVKVSGRPVMRLPYACLLLDGLGCFMRVVFWSVDPLCFRQIVSNALQSSGRTASIPFALSSTILLTFYWFETLTVRL